MLPHGLDRPVDDCVIDTHPSHTVALGVKTLDLFVGQHVVRLVSTTGPIVTRVPASESGTMATSLFTIVGQNNSEMGPDHFAGGFEGDWALAADIASCSCTFTLTYTLGAFDAV